MDARTGLIAGAGMGAGLAYFLDPGRGSRRRARIRDMAIHGATVMRRAIGTTSRDLMHRTYGTAATLAHVAGAGSADDRVTAERVRSKLGRLVSHPHAISLTAAEGVVTLRGPVLAREAAALVAAVRHVRGVHGVVDQLERHAPGGHMPALRGGRAPAGGRLDILQTHWAPTTRLLAGSAAAALLIRGLTRRGVGGTAASLVGGALLLRAGANMPFARLWGIGSARRAINVQKTITIHAPVQDVYRLWTSYGSFPRFMSRVLDVRTATANRNRSHWKVAGPGGVPVEFDVEVTRAVPNELLAWKTLPGSAIAHAGIVQFQPLTDGRTRAHLRMSYNPPVGWLGHGVAAAFGVDPKHSLDADLARMKTLIETGHAPHDAARPGRKAPQPGSDPLLPSS